MNMKTSILVILDFGKSMSKILHSAALISYQALARIDYLFKILHLSFSILM